MTSLCMSHTRSPHLTRQSEMCFISKYLWAIFVSINVPLIEMSSHLGTHRETYLVKSVAFSGCGATVMLFLMLFLGRICATSGCGWEQCRVR